jgi:hypothetical protein
MLKKRCAMTRKSRWPSLVRACSSRRRRAWRPPRRQSIHRKGEESMLSAAAQSISHGRHARSEVVRRLGRLPERRSALRAEPRLLPAADDATRCSLRLGSWQQGGVQLAGALRQPASRRSHLPGNYARGRAGATERRSAALAGSERRSCDGRADWRQANAAGEEQSSAEKENHHHHQPKRREVHRRNFAKEKPCLPTQP